MMIETVESAQVPEQRSARWMLPEKQALPRLAPEIPCVVCRLAPADSPQVAIAVLIENGGGGAAAPIASKIPKKALS